MLDFIRVLIYIINFMAVVSGLAVMIKSLSLSAEAFDTSNRQVKSMRISALILVLIYWFISTTLPRAECLSRYAELSKTCFITSGAWVSAALISMLLGIISALINAGQNAVNSLSRLRFTWFCAGLGYLLLSYLLKVV